MSHCVGSVRNVYKAFIDITIDQRFTELEKYLIDKDCEIENEQLSEASRLSSIIASSRFLYKNPDIAPQELESLMLTIVSLFDVLAKDDLTYFLDNLCTTVLSGAATDNINHRMKLLDLLFCQLDKKNPTSSIIFQWKIKTAVKYNMGSQLDIDVNELIKLMDMWEYSKEDRQSMLRLVLLLYQSIPTKKHCSYQVLTELVSTYTSFFDETVTESVTKLIVMAIADMDCYTFNDLLEMEAIQVVKSEKIYQLLEVFVTGKCTDFIKFCQLNDGYIESLGLDMSSCLHKIQVLTLLSLAENSSEIPFDVISSELQLEVYVFEQLIIDAIRSKLLTARIDHVNKKLIVTNCFHRTFDTNEWTVIYKELSAWKRSISKFRSNLKSVEFQHTCVQ